PLTPFEPRLVRRTLLISAAFFLLRLTEFFVVTWAPTILSREGLTLAAASRGGVMLTLGGMAGTLLVGAFGMGFGLVRVVGWYMAASFFMTLVFAFADLHALMVPVCAV